MRMMHHMSGVQLYKIEEEIMPALLRVFNIMIANSDSVQIRNFGTFKRIWRVARPGHDFWRSKRISVAGHYRIMFIPGTQVWNDEKHVKGKRTKKKIEPDT
jgi:nucleoid DNA-binding protein